MMTHEVFHLGLLPKEQAKRIGSHPAIRYKEEKSGQWQSVSWKDFSDKVDEVALALLASGVKIQENMGVFTNNMPQGLYTDFAAFAIRAVTVPMYATSSETQIQYIVNDAQIRYLFVGEQLQYDTAFKVHSLCPSLEKLIILDSKVVKNPLDQNSVYFADFVSQANKKSYELQYKALREQLVDTDIANILYTSGTTGESKGVMLHHSNYIGQFHAHFKVIECLYYSNQVSMDFLPLTHVFERGWTLLCMEAGVEICVNTDPHQILSAIKDVHPNMMCAVPRFWEKVYDGVLAKIATMSPTMQKVVEDALKVGKEYNLNYIIKKKRAPLGLSLKYKIYDKLVFHALKKAIGLEHGVFFPTAGAAIPPVVEEFIHSVGINMIAGYGLTESTATVSCDYGPKTLGSVGRPLPGIEVKIGDRDEILVRGSGITSGYYKKEHETREAFDADGFFHTGDAGCIKNGEIFITDRIKDLYKTSNGKYIAPQLLEGKLCVDKYIDQLAIIADKRKFVTALIIPVYEELEKYAESHHISYANRKELCENQRINEMIFDRIETLQQSFASYEKVKRFVLLPEPFSMEKGELTNTLKIKRPVLLKNYAAEIEKMYDV